MHISWLLCHLKRKGQTTTRPLCRTHSDKMWMGICLSNQQHDNGINLSPKLLSSGSTKPQWEAHITSANSPFSELPQIQLCMVLFLPWLIYLFSTFALCLCSSSFTFLFEHIVFFFQMTKMLSIASPNVPPFFKNVKIIM